MANLKVIALDVWKRLRHLIVAVDQLFGVVITLGKCYPDETPSSYAWRLELRNHRSGVFFRPKIDALFLFLFKQTEHCRKSYDEERKRAQMPPDLRDVAK